MDKQPIHYYLFGPFRLDARERILLQNDVPVSLAPKVLDVLFALVEDNGHIVEKNALMEQVWADTFVEESNVTQTISQLRKVLANGSDQRFIETVPRRGYRFVADVDRVYFVEQTDIAKIVIETEEDNPPLPGPARLPPWRPFRRYWLLLVAVLLIVGASTYFWLHQGPRRVSSIAVLPLRVEDEDEQAFGVGIADALIRQLGPLKEIKVRSIDEASKYAQDRTPIDAGRELKAGAVLEGTVKRLGDQAQVRVRLWRVDDGKQIGHEIKRDTKVTDLLAAQDSIAEQVARALQIELTSDQKVHLEKRATDDPVALERCMVGRYLWSQRKFADALKIFGEAVRRDPNYAAAQAGMADCYAALGSTGSDLEPKETLLNAYEYALKAKELDPDLPEAHTSLGMVHLLYYWDLDHAEAELKRAIEINPSCEAAQFWYTVYLTAAQRSEESIFEAKKAEQSDPTSSLMSAAVARALYYAGKYDDAAQQAQKIVAADPGGLVGHYMLGNCYEQKTNYREAIEEFKQVAKDTGNSPIALASLATAYALAGDRPKALEILRQLDDLSKSKYISQAYGAPIWAALGEHNKAFELLDKAFDHHESAMVLLKVEPTLSGLRSDPKFDALVKRIAAKQR